MQDIASSDTSTANDDNASTNTHTHIPTLDALDPALTSLVSANGSPPSDSLFNSGVLAALLNSPSNLQRVMSALHTLSPVATPADEIRANGSDMALTQNMPSLPSPPPFPLDASSFGSAWPAGDSSSSGLDHSNSDLLPTSSLANNSQYLQKLTDSTGRLDSHIDDMDTSIHSLLETLGVPTDALGGDNTPMSFDQLASGFHIEPLNFDLLNNPVNSSGTDSFTMPSDGNFGDGVDWSSFFPQLDGSTGPVEEDFNTFDSDVGSTSPASTAPALPVEHKVPSKRKQEVLEPDVEAPKPKRTTRKKK